LPELDPTLAAKVESHLSGCAPCRVEFDSLKEVDRRLVRLAEFRRTQALVAWRKQPDRLDRLFGDDIVGSGTDGRKAVAASRRWTFRERSGIVFVAASALALLAVSLLWLLRPWHR